VVCPFGWENDVKHQALYQQPLLSGGGVRLDSLRALVEREQPSLDAGRELQGGPDTARKDNSPKNLAVSSCRLLSNVFCLFTYELGLFYP